MEDTEAAFKNIVEHAFHENCDKKWCRYTLEERTQVVKSQSLLLSGLFAFSQSAKLPNSCQAFQTNKQINISDSGPSKYLKLQGKLRQTRWRHFCEVLVWGKHSWPLGLDAWPPPGLSAFSQSAKLPGGLNANRPKRVSWRRQLILSLWSITSFI